MTYDETLGEGSSFGKLMVNVHAINKTSHFHFNWYCLSIETNFRKEYFWKYVF